MLGVDLNTKLGTAFLAIVVSIIFVWGALYATTLVAVGGWLVIMFVVFIVLYFAGSRLFQWLKHGRRRHPPR